MDDIIEGIPTSCSNSSSYNHKTKKEESVETECSTDTTSNIYTDESNKFYCMRCNKSHKQSSKSFEHMLSEVIVNNKLSQYTSMNKEIVNYCVKCLSDKNKLKYIHELIRKELELIKRKKPEYVPSPLTLGAFFFGCYLQSDKYATQNKYCDAICAFSIPYLTDSVQKCDDGVSYRKNVDEYIRRDQNSKVCNVYLGGTELDKDSNMGELEANRLRLAGYEKANIYRGNKLDFSRDLKQRKLSQSENDQGSTPDKSKLSNKLPLEDHNKSDSCSEDETGYEYYFSKYGNIGIVALLVLILIILMLR